MRRTFYTAAILFAIVFAWLGSSHPAGSAHPPGDGGGQSPLAPPRNALLMRVSAPPPGQVPAAEPAAAGNPPALAPAPANPPPAVVAGAVAPGPRSLPVTPEFVRKLATGPATVSFALPDGRTATGTIGQRSIAADGSPAGVSGKLTQPGKGDFIFRIQPEGAPTSPVVGAVALDQEETAFRVMPGPANTSLLSEMPVDQVICRSYILPPEEADEPEEIPADHPTSIPIPAYQNGVIPLQSRPGAPGVIYLDFDGQPGPHENWGNFDAASPNVSNTTIKDVWTRVCEDYAPFHINVTTDLQVYLNASEVSRQRCIITPTTTASPTAGGVAWVGSFAWSGDTPCWSFYSSGKNGAEVIAHEVGHTLGLSHDGRFAPSEGYYLGHGTDPVGWAPIMGAGYYKNLSQWSRGEYLSANQMQDDVAIIAGNFNVGYRPDDAGTTHGTAALLEIFSGGVVNTQGTIETQTDVDAFRFTTTGGSVNLAISPVTAGPDLDILASIYDSTGSLVISNNPDTAINATLTANLPAGEYTVRVDGTGRGFALVDGYSDYGSLGQYTITGAIAGAIIPARFTIAENSPFGAAVGTPAPLLDHAGSPLVYSITAGNTGSALAIDPGTGAITVATPSVFDYEALSNSWTTPPALDLTVQIVDTVNSALNETLRVVVSVSNVNEAPSISGPSSVIALSHTVNGTPLATVAGSDPDAFDFPIYSIPAGNAGGKFSISQSGVISVAGSLDSTVQPSYSLTIRATDHGTPALFSDLPVTITVAPLANTYTPGFVQQTIYEDVGGADVASLTGHPSYPTAPSREVTLTSFTSTNVGDFYGSAVRAWLIAPYTGSYEFWISGDDAADLNFSAAGNPAATSRIAYLNTASGYQQWTFNPSQHSATVNLTAGQICYIEALQKEDWGTDHLSVAWQIKDTGGTTTLVPQEVIPGRYLSPHLLNYVPKVPTSYASIYQNSYAGHTVATPAAIDLNPADTRTWAITSGNDDGIFSINPATGQIGIANAVALAAHSASTVVLTLAATDNGSPPLAGSGSMNIDLIAPATTPTFGLVQEFWDGVFGSDLSNLYALSRYPSRPDRLVDLTGFDSGSSVGDNYGARIRAYVIPPVTGTYNFYIASDNNGALFLSTDSNPANATQIASVPTFSGYQYWTAYPSQMSDPVVLTGGQRYFIEGRVKESSAGDHLSVGWTGPANPFISVIGDGDTEPFDSNVAPAFGAASYSLSLPAGYTNGSVAGAVTAMDSPFEELRYAIVSGNPLGAFAINPVTGQITAANVSNISLGATYDLQVGVQDSGHGRHFVPKETLVPVSVTATGTNIPPEFTASPVTLGSFTSGQPFSASVASFVSDPGDGITFALVSGPSWLNVSSAGLLSGTPDLTDVGPHAVVVSANDGHGHVVPGNVVLTVDPPHHIPGTTLVAYDAGASLVAGSVFSGTAADASTSDDTFLVLREAELSETSSLEYQWTFATPSDHQVTLRADAFHSSNTEGDNFQVLVSTDGGSSFNPAFFVTKTSDDNTAQSFSFVTGAGSTTVVKVIDTDRTNGNTLLDSISIDLLALDIPANIAPEATSATFQVAHHSPGGVVIGSVMAWDDDPGQALSISMPRGNEAGYFAISSNGAISVASDIPEGAGPFSLVVLVTDNGTPALANYAIITVNVVAPLPAMVTLGTLTATYDGNPCVVGTTVDPPGLPVSVTYDGIPVPPVHPGSYAILARVFSPIYSGSAGGTLVVSKAAAGILVENLSQTYDGGPKSVTVTTTPPGLAVDITYNGGPAAPVNGGSHAVSVTINDPDYAGSETDTLVIGKAAATVTLGTLSHTYDGSPKSATAVTDPLGLDVVFTYNGLTTPPVNAGSYEVVATISSGNYAGSDTDPLVISPAAATIELADLSQTYDGTPRVVSCTTTPPGVAVGFLYNGSPTAPTNAGTYPVSAAVTDPNFTGSTSGSLAVAKAAATVTLGALSQAYDGTPKSASVTTTPPGLTVGVTYDASPEPPSAVGSYAVNAVVNETNYSGTASGTLYIRNNLVIAEGETLDPPDVVPIYQDLLNDGTLVCRAETLHFAGNAVNHGVLRLVGDAALDISGTFTNTGFIDIINWNGTLPPGLVNTGTILDRSAVRVLSVETSETHLTFSTPRFDGHLYQLQSSATLAEAWAEVGAPVAGSGSLAAPPALEFSPPLDGAAKFYRVQVLPAPPPPPPP